MRAIPHSLSITGLVLAGGRGMRMGGVDKGLQLFRGKTLVEHIIDRLAPQVSSLLINANQHQDTYAQFGYPVVADQQRNFAGPLAGIATAWSFCKTEYLLTVPCDSPFLPTNLAAHLSSAFTRNSAATTECTSAAIAATRETQGGENPLQTHPVFCLMHRSAAPALQAFVADGGARMHSFFDSIKTEFVIFDQANAFTNLNTLQDLQAYQTDSACSEPISHTHQTDNRLQ